MVYVCDRIPVWKWTPAALKYPTNMLAPALNYLLYILLYLAFFMYQDCAAEGPPDARF